jgi:hypothetical protein
LVVVVVFESMRTQAVSGSIVVFSGCFLTLLPGNFKGLWHWIVVCGPGISKPIWAMLKGIAIMNENFFTSLN